MEFLRYPFYSNRKRLTDGSGATVQNREGRGPAVGSLLAAFRSPVGQEEAAVNCELFFSGGDLPNGIMACWTINFPSTIAAGWHTNKKGDTPKDVSFLNHFFRENFLHGQKPRLFRDR
jgi:hypothetical protein